MFFISICLSKKIIQLFKNVVNNKFDIKIIIICIIFISFFSIEIVFSISISIRIISFAIFVYAKIIALLFVKKLFFDFIFVNIFFVNIFV